MTGTRIHKLDDSVAQKIAAGEVVDRPASVVKELAENAIDAGSTAIAIEIQDGGQALLRVADNGCGIHADDVRLAFMRHATSKISSADDLFRIQSMGFRGEALYSIAAVARLELLTRTQDSELGVRVVMEGGVEVCCEPVGCPLGTSVTVRDLFFNTPARRKFLGRPSAETASIGIMAAKLILSRPDISVKFASGGRTIYHSPGDGSLRNAITAVYGREFAENMIPAEGERGGIRVYGFIGNSETFRGNRSGEMLFVNGRMIESPTLARAIERVYAPLLMTRRFPSFILHIGMNPDMLDVNVHPQKSTVRFADEKAVQSALCDAVAATLAQHMGMPPVLPGEDSDGGGSALLRALGRLAEPVAPDAAHSAEPHRSSSARPGEPTAGQYKAEPDRKPERGPKPARQTDVREAVSALRESVTAATHGPVRDYMPGLAARRPLSPEDMTLRNHPQEPLLAEKDDASASFRVAGVLYSTYLIVESGDFVLFIDQHAAHERLLYERYMRALKNRKTLSQQLLIPQVIEVTHDEMIYIGEHASDFADLGFDLEEYGRLSFQVRAVPVIMGHASVRGFFREALDLMRGQQSADASTYRDRIIQLACKKAVKAGDALDEREIETVLALIRGEGVPLTCPHGRPFVMALSRRELEKKFKRLV